MQEEIHDGAIVTAVMRRAIDGAELTNDEYMILSGFAWAGLVEKMREDGHSEESITDFLNDNFDTAWQLTVVGNDDDVPLAVQLEFPWVDDESQT